MRFVLVAALLFSVSLGLSGCANVKSILEGGTSIIATTQNPVSRTNLAQVESAYGVVLTAAVGYRHACATKLIADTCRPVVVRLQAANRKAHAAIVAARNFVKNNPRLSALTLISAAGAAVSDFRTEAYISGVR